MKVLQPIVLTSHLLTSAAALRADSGSATVEKENVADKTQGPPKTAFTCDDRMYKHKSPEARRHPECPERYMSMKEGIAPYFHRMAHLPGDGKPGRLATRKEIEAVHTTRLVDEAFAAFESKKHACSDIFLSDGSGRAAQLAAGGLLTICDEIMSDSPVNNGFALARPPGHHAKRDSSSGFCLFNNVAIAARYLQQKFGLKKILILDWDVHHGNGTNEIFRDDPSVLFMSVHRHDNGAFYPGEGSAFDTGIGAGKGYNINVPLDEGYGDADLEYVFRKVIMPAADAFEPDFILLSSGFDAVESDPLGGCVVTPGFFGWMTKAMMKLAKKHCQDRLAVVTEGGYSLPMVGKTAAAVVSTLLEETGSVDELESTYVESELDIEQKGQLKLTKKNVEDVLEAHKGLALKLREAKVPEEKQTSEETTKTPAESTSSGTTGLANQLRGLLISGGDKNENATSKPAFNRGNPFAGGLPQLKKVDTTVTDIFGKKTIIKSEDRQESSSENAIPKPVFNRGNPFAGGVPELKKVDTTVTDIFGKKTIVKRTGESE